MRTLLRSALVAIPLACATPAPTSAPPPETPHPTGNAWFDAGRAEARAARARTGTEARAKNVILFIGDGMGVTTVTAARIFEGQRRGEAGEENLLAFERLPFTALVKTYTTDQQVPDSAGTATAMLSGVKTKTGVLGVDDRVVRGDYTTVLRSAVTTLLEEAETRGLATGIVTTTTVTHATPGACYAHVAHRDWEDDSKLPDAARAAGFGDIARQLIEWKFGDGPEVVLGGGRQHFLPKTTPDPEYKGKTGARLDGRDLVEEWRGRHPQGAYVWKRDAFVAVDPATTPQLFGLFEPSHMAFELDRARDPGGEPSLAEMTAKAIDIVSRDPDGFVLMIEGGRIDHGHHIGNAARALSEAAELSSAVRTALERTQPAETLIVVTADHSHTLTMSGYPKKGNPILGLVVGTAGEGDVTDDLAKDMLGLPYTTLGYANGPGNTGASDVQTEGPKRLPHFPKSRQPIRKGRPDLTKTDTTDPLYLQESAVPTFLETHGGEDVPLYAGGAGAALFHGVREQSYVYHGIVEALGWSEDD